MAARFDSAPEHSTPALSGARRWEIDMLVQETTLATTYTVQVQHLDDSWSFYSGGEYDSEADAQALASQIYGGQVPTRIVRVERHVID
jgi:hypothetical protein